MALCRVDAAFIAFFSYLVGAEMARGVELQDVAVAGLVTFISTNFIYSFNSWADYEVDRINKPYRPLPAGKITPKAALWYTMVLLFLSLVYPLFVFNSFLALFLFILLPLLGLIYSAKPFRTKTNPYLSIVTICIGLVTPMMLGYFMNSSDFSTIPFFVILFLFCLSVVPIKQAEEAAVDKIIGTVNLYAKFGEKIIFYTLSGLSLVFVLTLFLTIEHGLKGLMLIFTASIFAYILFYTKQKKKLERLYQHIIYIVTGEGVLFFCFRKLF